MRTHVGLVCLAVSWSATGEAQTVTSTAADRTSVAVTVYNDGRGLVREERQITLPAGVTELRFVDVAEKVESSTVGVTVVDGGAVSLLEQNYEYDLLSPQKLLDKFVGQTVTLVQQRLRDGSTVEEDVPAKLLSTSNGTVWEAGGRIVTNPPYSRLVFPNVPANLIARPTLVWVVDAAGAGRRRIETAYLTQGMSWRADYVLSLDAAETRAGLSGWVTIDNQSGAGYENARLKLVAGDLHRAEEAAPPAGPLRQAARADVREEALFEYHLYSLPRPTTLKEKQTKQVRLLDVGGVAVGKEYVLRSDLQYFEAWTTGVQREPIAALITLKNDPGSGLGIPLPRGIVRVYKRDSTGSAQFIGEDRIEHTPQYETLRLEVGQVFDVAAERRQTDFKRLSDNVTEAAYEVRIRNRKTEAVTIRVIERVSGDWTMVDSSQPHRKTSAFEVEFDVAVAPGQETALTYRVRVQY